MSEQVAKNFTRICTAGNSGIGKSHTAIPHLHLAKVVLLLDRYGLQMCIGCGRCVDADAGGIDIRAILKKLNEEIKNKSKAKVAK